MTNPYGHTPQPWLKEATAKQCDTNFWVSGIEANGNIIAHAYGNSQEEAQANAVLIAQAPALLKRVRELEKCLGELSEQIDCLSDVEFSKDIEQYKSEANWNNALELARITLSSVLSAGGEDGS